MPSPKPILRSRWAPALALLGTLAAPGIARADFKITYVFTDEEGEPILQRRLATTDMQRYSNQASCQCGHLWGVRVFLDNSTGTTYPGNTQIDTYVGYNCGAGQEGVGPQDKPCVKLYDGNANDYDDGGIVLSFEQVWLSSRSDARDEATTTAVPLLPCDAGQTGGGGIWVCVESNGEANCQSEEFVIQGDQSENSGGGTSTPTTPSTGGTGMDMGAATNVLFDYTAPQDDVSGFRAEAGDGAVVISWDRGEMPDTSGFRVLCADLQGNTPVDKIDGIPEGISRTNGKLYYTAQNLCGSEYVYDPQPYTPPDSGTTSDGSDTGRETEGSDTGLTSGSDTGLTSSSDTGLVSSSDTGLASSDTGLASSSDTGLASSGTDTGTGGSDTGGDGATSVLESLDWRYVCSDHVTATGTSARVSGLENGKEYEFIVVSYDNFGNPKIVSEVLTATPVETSDFWEQCEKQDDLCGSGGFCACTSEPEPTNAAWFGAGLVLLGVARRRRGPRR
jgi:MYXO-CTERM domain-containing protein